MKLITEETYVKYDRLDDLSFFDTKNENVDLYVKDECIGEIEVFTDRENENREYICINYEIVYLDTIRDTTND